MAKKARGKTAQVSSTSPGVVAVDLSTLKLPEDAKARVGEQLSRALLDELAQTDKAASPSKSAMIVGRLRKDWYGGIRLDALKRDLQQQLAKELEAALQPGLGKAGSPVGSVPDTAPALSAVDLSSVKLPGVAKARIGAQLTRSVMDELARTDNTKSASRSVAEPALVGLLRKDWYGGIRIRELKPELQERLSVEIENTLNKSGR